MSYISEMLRRANLQDLREFLKTGCEVVEYDTRPYQEREKRAVEKVRAVLRDKIHDPGECEEASNAVMEYAGDVENIYMELGLRCGFILAAQMLGGTHENIV